MKIDETLIIRMTEEEFNDLMQKYSFKSRKEMATYLENTYTGGRPCDVIQVTGISYKCYIYMRGDEYLGK